MTADLIGRVWQRRDGTVDGFTKQHGCRSLVWYELHGAMRSAVTKEKQNKGGSRGKKLVLIETGNPFWRDLYDDIVGPIPAIETPLVTAGCPCDEAVQGQRTTA